MKYFAKLVDGVPSGDVYHEGAAALSEEAIWVEAVVPAYPKDGYMHKLSRAIVTDGVAYASWEQIPDENHAAREAIIARQMRESRDARIKAVEWRYARYDRNARLGLQQQDDLSSLDAYVQALADVTKQAGFPWDIQWPSYTP